MSRFPDQSAPNLLAEFISALQGLQASVTSSHIDGRSLQPEFLSAQQLYQQQLLPTLATSPQAASLGTYQTEINRALRLLGMDVAFLQSAKTAMTVQKRQAQMRQRLQSLLEFCQGLETQLKG